MKINIYNNQDQLQISKKLIQKLIRELAIFLNVTFNEISVYLVDEKKIIKLHKEFFNDPTTTDCISFPIDSIDEDRKYCFLGEVFVCVKTAIEYSLKNNLDPYDETSLYIIHGILHLLGYDDISEKDKTIMRKKEKSCMNLIKAKKLGISAKHTKRLQAIK